MNLLEAMRAETIISGYAVILPTHSKLEDIEFTKTSVEPSLETLQRAVGGFIEHISLDVAANIEPVPDPDILGLELFAFHDGYDGIVNEEGKLEGLSANLIATAWFALSHPGVQDTIAGPMVVLFGAARLK